MCLGVPMQVTAVDGVAALCVDGEDEHLIDISLIDPVRPGDWVLTFLGAARGILDAGEAGRIRSALDGLRRLMAGGELGDAFADLEHRTPELPPHLRPAPEETP
ncbi:HypC/HybG/HupF family hydrogenase formation chaperone [Rhodobacteraceae bacterium CCMM004]|nr:HypC/HybG/HupF family hydrogenase formation chaperone [Rhodobacteraceae bacterium CCMM004]